MSSHVSSPRVTVVVVPRERFGVTRRALEAVYATTREPFHLIYVDGVTGQDPPLPC
jgi:hypothetical protein